METDAFVSWSCEIGSVPFYRVPEGGDSPLRRAVQYAFEGMFPGVESSISSGWGMITAALPDRSESPQANLGCATTEELIRELIARFITHENSYLANRAVILAELLGGLNATDREYRTIDS